MAKTIEEIEDKIKNIKIKLQCEHISNDGYQKLRIMLDTLE